jgi:hypothetical protein
LLKGNEWEFQDHPQFKLLKDLKSGGYLIAPKQGVTREEAIELLGQMGGSQRGESSDARGGAEGRRDGLLGSGVGGSGPSFGYERPGDYDQWDSYQRSMWDLTANQGVQRRSYELGMAYAHEQQRRQQFEYFEQVRHHEDHVAGLPYIETPPAYNYRTMGAYNEENHPAYPQSHDSEWFPRYSCVGRVEGSSSDPPQAAPDPFEAQSLYRGLMESIFGSQRPPQ